jgi:hypothetical protein
VIIKASANTPLKEGQTLESVPTEKAVVKLGILQKIIDGELKPGGAVYSLAKVGIQKAVTNVLSHISLATEPKVVQHAEGAWTPVQETSVEELKEKIKEKAAIFNQPGKAKIMEFSEPHQVVEPSKHKVGIPTPVGEIPKVPKVKLATATMLLQPVRGTDDTSTYFCVALSPDLKVAARLKESAGGGAVSIRVEGPGVNLHGAKLKEAGLDHNDGYFSGHFKTGDKNLAYKTVGAVLMAMHHAWEQMAFNMDPIWGKGA